MLKYTDMFNIWFFVRKRFKPVPTLLTTRTSFYICEFSANTYFVLVMTTQRTLAICQLFNPVIHGRSDECAKDDPNGHYLALHTYDDEYDDSPYAFLDFWTQPSSHHEVNGERDAFANIRKLLEEECEEQYDNDGTALTIAGIRELPNVPRVEIVDTIELDSGHLVAIKKTLWLSIFQRMLKKRYSQKQRPKNHIDSRKCKKQRNN
jgi:hypothetical protein